MLPVNTFSINNSLLGWIVVEQARVGMEYIPTEEERRVFRECNQESFWYRCKCLSFVCAQMMIDWVKSRVPVLFFTAVPFSVVSMAVTQALVARGNPAFCVNTYAKINVSETDQMLNFVLIIFCLQL